MRKNRSIAYGPLLLLLILFISCKDVPTKGNFIVTGPESWLRKDTVSKDGSKKVQFFRVTADSATSWHENISIAIVHSKNFKRYINSVIEGIKEKAIFFEEKGKADTVLNGYKARWVQIIVLYEKAADDEKKEQRIYFVSGEGDNIYMIVTTARKDGFPIIQNSLDKVLHSFKIVKEEASK